MALKDIQKPRRIIKFYHGSKNTNLTSFDIQYSRKSFLDFGVGIYFTTSMQQAIEWSVRHSNTGAVYEIELDASQLHLKQYLTYSNKFIDTFCLCRAGYESLAIDIHGYEAVYGFVIDNDKHNISYITAKYAIGDITYNSVRNSIKVFDNKDQLCIKSQQVLNKLTIKDKLIVNRIFNKQGKWVNTRWQREK